MAEHTVRARFELDDHSRETLAHIKEGFAHLEEKASEVGGEIAGIFKTSIGTAIGFQLSGAVETFKEMGEEVLHAAADMEEQEKAIRGVLMMTDKEGTSLEEMSAQAHELNESFAQMAVETGGTKAEMIAAFDEMAERTGMSTENVEKLTREMAQAGRAIPGGARALSEGFSNLAAGIYRPRNEIIKLIAATGTLHGNARAVAKQLQAMSPEKAMQLGIDAVEKMSGKMASVPLTFGETIKSLAALREGLFETVGTPMLAALAGPLHGLGDYFVENKEEIVKWATAVGKDVGEWLKSTAVDVKEGFQYLQAHSHEIKEDILAAMRFVRDTVEFIIEHRTALALAWGATKVPGAIGAVGGLVKGAKGAGGVAMGFGRMLAGVGAAGGEAAAAGEAGAAATGGASAFGVSLGSGAGAAAAGLGAFAAAAVSVGVAVDQGIKLWEEGVTRSSAKLDEEARMRALLEAAENADMRQVNLFKAALDEANPSLVLVTESIREMAATKAALATQNAADITSSLAFEEEEAGKKTKGGGAAKYAVQSFMKDLDFAVQQHDAATLAHMADFISTHKNILAAMHTAGVDMTKEGKFLVGALMNLGRTGTAEEVKGIIAKQLKASSEGATAGVVNNFHGGVQIHQDFKDVDPDRIALIFDRHLAKSALAKAQAATQVAHTAF
jgi:hypothetical protein